MDLLRLIAIVAVLIVPVIGMVSFVRNISFYYKDRFRFSLWSGVFTFLFVITLLIILGSSNNGAATFFIEAISMLFVMFVVYKDIHLAGVGWGLLAVGLQCLFTISILLMLIILVIEYLLRRILSPQQSGLFPSISVALGMNGEIHFLFNFLHI